MTVERLRKWEERMFLKWRGEPKREAVFDHRVVGAACDAPCGSTVPWVAFGRLTACGLEVFLAS